MLTTVHLTVYHNQQSRFAPYTDGDPLHAVASHLLLADTATPADRIVNDTADWAFHTFNTDLDTLERDRADIGGELAFLAACVYRLMRLRSLSVGDVLRLRLARGDVWLACERFGWRRITTPTNLTGDALTPRAVYRHIAGTRPWREPRP